jgi:hypothetical protein
VAASAARAAATASIASSLPRSRRSARDAAALQHGLAASAQETSEAGAVVADSFHRPGPRSARVLLGEAKSRPVAASVCAHCLLGDERACGCRQYDQQVFVSMGIDTDHAVQLICKHPTDPPAGLVGSGGAGLSAGNRGGRTVISYADTADKLLIKPAAGARPASPGTRRQFIPKARTKRPVTR